MSSSTISKNTQLYSTYDNRTVANSQLYSLLYNADVWVDASDTSTFTLTGTGIQRQLSGNWNDKSRNANNLVPTAASGIYYDDQTSGFVLNTQYFMPTNTIRSANSETFFLVVSFWGNNISTTQYALGFNPSNSVGQRLFRIDNVGLRTLSNATTVLLGASPIIEARRYLLGFSNNNGFLQHFINGKLDGSVSGTTFTSNNPTAFFGNAGSNVQLRGVIHECLFYQSALSENQRQLIEYYLMNKWKLPPNSIANPTSVTGCRLWLDASDPSSLTLSGSSVTQWNDKSGFSNHAVGITSYLPTYTSATQLNFNGSQGLRSNYVISAAGETIFTVMKSTTLNASIQQWFIDSSDTAGGRNYRLPTSGTRTWYCANGGGTTLAGIIGFTTASYTINMLHCGVIARAGGTTQYINKVRDTSSASANNPGTGTYTQIGARSNPPGNGLNGSISEIVAYNTVLSASDRELVSNYLMNKWSLSSLNGTFVNTYNSFQIIPPRLRYFTPNDIDNCSLWLDASDRRTLFQNSAGTTLVTATGQGVNFWADKSPSVCNATNSVNFGGLSAYSSINGMDSISFATNSYLSLTPSLMPTGSQQGISVFIICKTTISANQCVISWGTGDGSTSQTVYYGYIIDTPNNSSTPFVGRVSGDGTSINALAKNLNIMISSVSTSSTQNPIVLKGWYFGSPFGSTSNTPFSSIGTVFASIGRYAGASPSATQYLTGNVAEIIVYNRYLPDSERQQIEGYLANKWGFRSNLPSNHTLKNIIPLVPAFNPKSIPTCTFWYDIADPSTLTYASGSTVNVTAVKDKSGRGLDLLRDIYTTGRELTTANKLNGLPTLTFPGDPAGNNATLTYLRSTVALPLTSASNYVFFVMRFNPYVLEGTTTARSWSVIYPFNIGVVNGAQGGMSRNASNNWTLQYGISNVGSGALGTAIISTSASGPSVGTPFLAMFGKTAAAQYVFSYNGLYETLAGTSATVAGGQPLNIGIFFQAQELCEMIYYTGKVLTVQEIAKIDGYLAWKWGLQGNLPASHLYKKTPP